MQKQNSPFNAGLGVRGARVPQAGGTVLRPLPPGPPQLSAPPQTPRTRRGRSRWVGGRCVTCSSALSPSAGLSHSQPELGLRRNPRAALPGARPGHPCHIHQLPLALPSWDWSLVGTGRSPQDAALHCVHLSSTVPSPQEQGHPGWAVQGGLGSAQPGQEPAGGSSPRAQVGRS